MTPTACNRVSHADPGRAEPSVMPAPSPLVVGAAITIEFPTAVVSHDGKGPYVVVDVDGHDTLTARSMLGEPPAVRVGTPCLVHSTIEAERQIREAIVLSSGPGGVIVQVHPADEHRLPHCRRPMTVLVEVPGTQLGVVEGVTEEISVGGVRARVPVELPTCRRAFISLPGEDSTPILAVATILACGPTIAERTYFLRAEFTLVSPHDQLRLFALMNWSTLQPTARVEGHNPSLRHLIRFVSTAASDRRRQ
jgi:hypothetical protein